MFSNIVTQTEESKLENRNGIALSGDAIRIEASDFLLAGADTTSNTLTYVVWSIPRCPGLHRRVLQELDLLGDNFDDAALRQLLSLKLSFKSRCGCMVLCLVNYRE
ncbi:hypothetical protein V2G26_000016 [Clonostachys chloroleuca]